MGSYQGDGSVDPVLTVRHSKRVSAVVGDILLGLGVDETQEGQLNGLNVVGDLEIMGTTH